MNNIVCENKGRLTSHSNEPQSVLRYQEEISFPNTVNYRGDLLDAFEQLSKHSRFDLQEQWDKELKEDVTAGRLENFNKRALEAHKSGDFTEL